MTMKHLAYRFAHEFAGGVIGLAAMMGKGQQVLSSKLNPNVDTHHLTVDEFEMLGDFTNRNEDIARYFAEKINAVLIKLPEAPIDGDMGMLDLVMSSIKELGEVFSVFQVAWADGRINAREYDQVSNEIDDVIARLLEFKAAVKRVSK